jgi:hypothetical protein
VVPRAPRRSKNSNAPLAIFVLPIDLRSFVAIMRVLNEFLVDPAPAVMTSPYLSENEPARNRPPWNDDGPKVPDFRPSGFRGQVQHLKIVVPVRCHLLRRSLSVRARGAACSWSVAAKRSSSWTRSRSRRNSRNRLARPPSDVTCSNVRCLDPGREPEEIIFKKPPLLPFHRTKPPSGI